MKITFKHRADYYFWAFALVVIIKGIIGYLLGDEGIVINVHDSYYVFGILGVILINAGVLFIIGLVYYVLYTGHVPLLKKLTKLHTAACMLVYITAWISLPILEHYHNGPVPNLPWYTAPDVMLLLYVLLFLIIQLLLIINAATGIIKKLRAGN